LIVKTGIHFPIAAWYNKRTFMKKIWVSISLLAVPVPLAAYALDNFDAELRSRVTDKVQRDHAADMKAGRIAHSMANHGSASSASGPTTVAAAAPLAVHPNQVQDLKRRKKKIPPPNTAGGAHHQHL
jgi:hypothetical protein